MNEPRLALNYVDRQGVRWSLADVRPSESLPNFVHALAGPERTPVHICVDDVRVHIVRAVRGCAGPACQTPEGANAS